MKIKLNYRIVNNKDIALISGNMGKLYEEGIPFTIILPLLRELPLTKEYKESINDIEKIVQNGGTLEEAFKSCNELFTDFFSSIVGIGEKTGKISEVLTVLEFYYSKRVSINKVIINACTYPIILITAVLFLFLFMIIFLVPSFSDIYIAMGKDIPKICKFMLEINKVIINRPLIALIYIIIWGVLIPYLLISKVFKYRINNLLFKIPLYKRFNEYIVVLLLSIVIKSGINLSVGLDYCTSVKLLSKNRDRIKQINKDIVKGKTLTEAMENSMIFSNYTLAHIKLGEETGTLDGKISLLEKELFENIVFKINRIVENIQPVMIIVIGILILSFILTFITPLFNVMDAL